MHYVVCFLTLAIVLSWSDAQPSELELREDSVGVPSLSVRREGESVVDTFVRIVPRGITATGNHTQLVVIIAVTDILPLTPSMQRMLILW